MTNTNISAILADINDNGRALQSARDDIAFYMRLKAAKNTAYRLAKHGNDLCKLLVEAVEADCKQFDADNPTHSGLAR